MVIQQVQFAGELLREKRDKELALSCLVIGEDIDAAFEDDEEVHILIAMSKEDRSLWNAILGPISPDRLIMSSVR